MTPRWLFVLFSLTCMNVNASTSLESWIAANSDPAETLICKRELNGEYFFVARAGDDDKLRLGSRVDLSAYRPQTLSITVAWKLRNEDHRFITAKIVPTVVKQEYLRVEGKAYAESVEYQTVNLGRSRLLRADVAIEKCPSRPCAEGSLRAMKYTVEVCETAL